MKLFFLYNISNASAVDAARKFAANARALGHESFDLSFPDAKARLLDARLLFVFFDGANDVYSWALEEYWRLYYDELTWYRRKSEGEIICVLNCGMEKDMLPFNLQDCKILRYNDISALTETLKRFSPQKPPIVPVPAASAAKSATQIQRPAAAPPKPIYQPVVSKTAKRGKATKIIKSIIDWIWLIAVVPLSVGVMYGIAAAVDYLNVSVFILLLPIASAFVFLLSPAANLPFHASAAAGKCAKYFRLAAIAACLITDIVFTDFSVSAIPEINIRSRAIFRIIAYAAIPCIFWAIGLLTKKFNSLNFSLYFRFSPLAAYLACHTFDSYLINIGHSFIPLILLLFVFLVLGSILRSVLRKFVKPRILLKCINALGYAAFIALFIAAFVLSNPIVTLPWA